MPDSHLHGVWASWSGMQPGMRIPFFRASKMILQWSQGGESLTADREIYPIQKGGGWKLRGSAQAALLVGDLVSASWSSVDRISLCSPKMATLAELTSIHLLPRPPPLNTASTLHRELWKTEFPFLCSLHGQQKWHTQQALLTPKQLGLFLLFLWLKFPGESKLFQEVLTATR